MNFLSILIRLDVGIEPRFTYYETNAERKTLKRFKFFVFTGWVFEECCSGYLYDFQLGHTHYTDNICILFCL